MTRRVVVVDRFPRQHDSSLAAHHTPTLRELVEAELRARGWIRPAGRDGYWQRIRDERGYPLDPPWPTVTLHRALRFQLIAEERGTSDWRDVESER